MPEVSPSAKRDIIHKLVDLDRYPIDRLDDPTGAEFLRQCQNHMSLHGWCNFDDFIRPEAVEDLADEARRLLPGAETLTIKRNIYQGKVDENVPDGDPRRREYVHTAQQLADDQIPDDSLIDQLYQSDLLTEFVRRVQQKPVLYRYADEFQALNIVALHPGSWHAWHYDVNECTVTLLLQAADDGGHFTFLPNSRTDKEENREAVDRLLNGDLSQSQSFRRGAGTFTLFRGGYSLHGVTEVLGTQPRITAILTYDEQPDSVASVDVNVRIYGERVKKILDGRRSA